MDVTGDTNGVFQLRDGVYNSNWANQGANENDLVIYSEEIDSLDDMMGQTLVKLRQ